MTGNRGPDTLLLAARELDQSFGGRKILDRVSIEVHAGEIVTVVGPNGAGKTTLLKILLGIRSCRASQVWRKPGIRMGYVPQNIPIDPVMPMTVGRFLNLGMERKTESSIREALELTGVAHLYPSPVHGLSGGEFKRMVLARAMLGRPDVLVLDEPVQGVDYAGELELYRLIGTLRDQFSCGVLLVSHDLHIVMRATDRVVCLNHHVCCTGQPEQVSNHPEFKELFGAQVVESLALYYHHHHRCKDH
ncbi:MAG: ATP-binding cassette domain-containing protein [Magnetococcales bacterium]|nr:ATP-binding cassette domain-containing protein [Magnetococcales bacterium]MBF0151700.1 ATP-binding cassette domain-containing protein [Magnetococcales bacterium]MBF0173738.1 ATP-binding cassette domain-containing protein [Magnetococcales bacterium]